MKVAGFFSIIFLIASQFTVGQGVYNTLTGHIIIEAKINSQLIIAESHELAVALDLKKMKVIGNLDLKKLDTGIDSLNQLLRNEPSSINFSGSIPFSYKELAKQSTHTIEFKLPLTIKVGLYIINEIFSATLEHLMMDTSYTCIFSVGGYISPESIGLENTFSGLKGRIKILIAHVVLRRHQ